MTEITKICGTITGDKPAVLSAAGQGFSYAELETLSISAAKRLCDLGLKRGDSVALMLENRVEFCVWCWAAQRSGLYYTPVATHLLDDEALYIADDCDAQVIVTSERFYGLWQRIRTRIPGLVATINIDEAILDPARADADADLEEYEGFPMLYSSGTTGNPKGIWRPLTNYRFGEQTVLPIYRAQFAMDADTVYLSPAPMYHAAPLRTVMSVQRLGGTVILQTKFDAWELLQAIERFRVTHIQLVPTMLYRLLALPTVQRDRIDLSSLRVVIHAAAPCPIDLKRRAIDWLGDIVCEYYGGTEGAGVTFIDAQDWLSHPGSVGRAVTGEVHIISEEGIELPPGEVGEVFFAGGPSFEYYNAPEKTAAARNDRGWVSLGDMGYIDDDGFLYLCDRKSFTIISGGVNIYPSEIEQVLLAHPKVKDAAVIGVPNEEFGEEVKAVVVAETNAESLLSFCRERLSAVKCPRTIDVVTELPRSDVGKVLKSVLRQQYRERAA